MSTQSMWGRSEREIGGSCRLLRALNGIGEQYVSQTGSVSMESPSNSMRKVEWPIQRAAGNCLSNCEGKPGYVKSAAGESRGTGSSYRPVFQRKRSQRLRRGEWQWGLE